MKESTGVATTSAVASERPLQLGGEELTKVTEGAGGSVKVIVDMDAHPILSETVTLKVPAHRPVAIAVVWLLAAASQVKR